MGGSELGSIIQMENISPQPSMVEASRTRCPIYQDRVRWHRRAKIHRRGAWAGERLDCSPTRPGPCCYVVHDAWPCVLATLQMLCPDSSYSLNRALGGVGQVRMCRKRAQRGRKGLSGRRDVFSPDAIVSTGHMWYISCKSSIKTSSHHSNLFYNHHYNLNHLIYSTQAFQC